MKNTPSRLTKARNSTKIGTAMSLILLFFSGCIGIDATTQNNAGNEYHVCVTGADTNPGSPQRPLRTIQAAADIAQPGDTITVHAGVYRERINPPRGGLSDERRITYQAAPDAEVIIKGSEIIKGWERAENDTWKVVIPNAFFGDFNPYQTLVAGDWFTPLPGRSGRVYHTGTVYLDGHWLREAPARDAVLAPAGEEALWFGEVDAATTTLYTQFQGVDPNERMVEINVRETVFYPEKTGINYITVRGFTMEHAATNWSPPTAEQVGLIGTHWSKGWIIENNTIRYSLCTGITLGKHGDEFDNTSASSAEGYVETIKRGIAAGWSKENIGHHIVRNNHISYCEQAGIVGSMGAIFSTVADNVIHDINMRGMFGGHEMAGIKFHAPIDTLISGNHVYRCGGFGGIWLDWMTQGARVTGNLLHDNHRQDLFVEVNHGPFMVDHNIFLSDLNLLESSGGGAYAHNLFNGAIRLREETRRDTPYHKPHSTEILGLSKGIDDDQRFHNNLFFGRNGLSAYDAWEPKHLQASGNVYLGQARPSLKDRKELLDEAFEPGVILTREGDAWRLELSINPAWAQNVKREIVTTETLGKAIVPDAPYLNPDGTPYRLDTDYFGNQRDPLNPSPGPFEMINGEQRTLVIHLRDRGLQ